MPRNGQGQYILPPLNPVVPDTVIATAWANGTLDDMSLALSTSICTDGQTTPTANLPMAGFRHTTVGAALAFNQYTRADQSQAFSFNILATVTVDGTLTAYAGTLPLGSGASQPFTNLQPVLWTPPQTNAGPSTLQINSGTVTPIVDFHRSPLDPGVLVGGHPVFVVFSQGAWVLVTNTLDTGFLDGRYLKLAGGTMTGALLLSGAPTVPLQAATKGYVDSSITGSVSGVASFNTRTGIVTLQSSDVITALGYTPFNSLGGTIGAGPTTLSTTGVTTGGILASRYKSTSLFINPATGTVNLQPVTVNTNYLLNITGPVTITIEAGMNIVNIFRVTFWNTSSGLVTWPAAVVWPMPTLASPDLTAGPLKKAIVVLEWDGAHYLANATVF